MGVVSLDQIDEQSLECPGHPLGPIALLIALSRGCSQAAGGIGLT
jgi:hypothetical protein